MSGRGFDFGGSGSASASVSGSSSSGGEGEDMEVVGRGGTGRMIAESDGVDESGEERRGRDESVCVVARRREVQMQ